jgi:putative DNA primase/helicase
MEEVFASDTELIEFMQRFIGYCLTGETREEVLAVFYGLGCYGKSTLLAVLRWLLAITPSPRRSTRSCGREATAHHATTSRAFTARGW